MNIESLKAKLKNYSKQKGKIHQNTITKFFQERFLYRLSMSEYRKNFLLKGGALIYTLGGEESRHTRDIDFLINKLDADTEKLKVVFTEICEMEYEDGVVFDSAGIKLAEIQKEGSYTGTRIKVQAQLGNIAQQVQIDIGVGDHVTPGPLEVKFPVILEELPSPVLSAYSIETLVSEKFHAMIDLGEYNSRLKDFYDICNFVESCDEKILTQAIFNTFQRRNTQIVENHPVFGEEFYTNEQRLNQWNSYIQKNNLKEMEFLEVQVKIVKNLYPIYKKLF